MGKRGSVWVDDQSYIERIKNRSDLPVLKNIDPREIERWCNFDTETKTLTLRLNNGQLVALTFRRNKNEQVSGQALLFEVGYELWEEGLTNFDLKEVLNRCSAKMKKHRYIADATSQWFKNTRVNLRRTIKHSPVKNLVIAFDTEHPRSGNYQFFVKRLP